MIFSSMLWLVLYVSFLSSDEKSGAQVEGTYTITWVEGDSYKD